MSEGTVSTEPINQRCNKSDTRAGEKRPDGGATDEQDRFLSRFMHPSHSHRDGGVVMAPRSPSVKATQPRAGEITRRDNHQPSIRMVGGGGAVASGTTVALTYGD